MYKHIKETAAHLECIYAPPSRKFLSNHYQYAATRMDSVVILISSFIPAAAHFAAFGVDGNHAMPVSLQIITVLTFYVAMFTGFYYACRQIIHKKYLNKWNSEHNSILQFAGQHRELANLAKQWATDTNSDTMRENTEKEYNLIRASILDDDKYKEADNHAQTLILAAKNASPAQRILPILPILTDRETNHATHPRTNVQDRLRNNAE